MKELMIRHSRATVRYSTFSCVGRTGLWVGTIRPRGGISSGPATTGNRSKPNGWPVCRQRAGPRLPRFASESWKLNSKGTRRADGFETIREIKNSPPIWRGVSFFLRYGLNRQNPHPKMRSCPSTPQPSAWEPCHGPQPSAVPATGVPRPCR